MTRLTLLFAATLGLLVATPLVAQRAPSRSFGDLAGAIAEATRDGAWKKGESAAAAALELRPDHPELLFHRAYFRARMGREVDALADLGRVADLGLTLPVAERFRKHLSEDRLAALQKRYDALLAPRGKVSVDGEIGPATLDAAAVVHDERRQRSFVGGRHRQEVWVRDAQGKASVFVKRGTGGMWGVGAMVIDTEADLLWVAASARRGGEGTPANVVGRAGLFAFRLRDAKLAHRILIPKGFGPRELGGLVRIDGDTLVASCLRSGELLRFDRRRQQVTILVRRGVFTRPRAIAPLDGGRWLVVSDDEGPLRRVDARTGNTRIIRRGPRDALYRLRDLRAEGRSLVALQTGFEPARVLRLKLDRAAGAILECEVLASGWSELRRARGLTKIGGQWRFLATTGTGRGARAARVCTVAPATAEPKPGAK